jgi:hypothetical protein
LVVIINQFDVLDRSAELNINVITLKKSKDWPDNGLVLIIPCDIQTAQDTQAVDIREILSNSAPELCSTMPWLKAEPGNRKLGEETAHSLFRYLLGRPDQPKGSVKKPTWKHIPDRPLRYTVLSSEQEAY